ncbi:facilitated trehalose transporter Tret1-like [Ptiloglossa arizonensis]|uniref:facilitated trehalose transporter Tret1-like n=1 Tax=Ptiloglossa arizonensis TaxID=3350558 RepID=UPI003FA16230
MVVHEANGKPSRNVTWPQWIAGSGVGVLMIQLGLMTSWSSPYIPQLTSPESSIQITMTEVSWVVSLLNLGRLIGALTGSLCVNYLGTKTTILFTNVAVTLCWTFTIVANSVVWLYASRLFGGITIGMTYTCFSLYMGEIADPSIRGALVALCMIGIPIGNFLMSIMGAYLSMQISGTISLIPCLVMLILFLWLPESPHYLIRRKLDEKAKESIRWYHRNCDVESEFVALQKFVENTGDPPFLETLKEFRMVHYRKSLILFIIIVMYSQLCGVNNVLFYMEPILTSAKVTTIAPAQVVIIVMASGIVGSILSMFLMDRFGRKFLMIVSCSGVTFSLCLLSAVFHLLDYDYDPKVLEGLSIFSVVFFYMAIFVGILPVPPAILSELFPPHQKCLAAFIGSSLAGVFSFISTSTYLPLLDLMTEHYTYLFYGLLIFSAVPYTLIFVPETKGLSLQEIQRRLMKK